MCVLCDMADAEPSMAALCDRIKDLAPGYITVCGELGLQPHEAMMLHGSGIASGLGGKLEEVDGRARCLEQLHQFFVPLLFAGHEQILMERIAAANTYVKMLKTKTQGAA